MARETQILFLASEEEKDLFQRAAESVKQVDGGPLTLSEFLRRAAHKEAERLINAAA